MSVDGSVDGGLDEPTELEPEQGSLDLASPEDRYARSDWEAAAAAVLRKAKRMSDDDDDALVWDKLSRTTLDEIKVVPLGTPDLLADLRTAGRPTRTGDWDIRALHGDVRRAPDNEELLVDLDGGVTSLWLRVDGATDFAAVLKGVLLDLAPVALASTGDELATARAFLAHADGTTLPAETNLGLDAATATSEGVELATAAGVRGFVIDATTVHDAGASDVQELGWSMATAATYLRRLADAGVDVDTAAGLVEFRYAVTDEQFPQIAKLRAARRLWSRVVELSGGSAAEQRQHAVTSRPMMSRYDPYVNLLRTTVAAFAAGVGGADAVTVLPFDSPLGRPETLGRRIARNTSPLLMWESHVAKVADPAGGSYAVEKLTDDLAVAAWEELGRLEADGLDAFHERVAAVAAARRERGRQAEATHHRAHRVPQPGRDPARARGRRGVRRGPCLRRELRGAPGRTGLRPGLPRHPRLGRRAHRPWHVRHQPVRRRRHRRRARRCRPRASRSCWRPTPASTWSA